ncbi:MAG: MBOAT family protein [Microscillaceae bacterium]|nr:MBOAT family protein [Microscillaceae bacterium]MDW8459842.1 MBOAT family O-acyltransferase [Cytophagales bacterium]
MLKENLRDLFAYIPDEPMLFNSGLFLVFFTIFITFYYLFAYKNTTIRLIYVVIFSFFFYYKASGWYLVILLFSIVLDYWVACWLDYSQNPIFRKTLLIISIWANVSLLMYFKYTNFFLSNWYALHGKPFEAWDIFLPIGISFYTFQTISYVVDVYNKVIPACRNLIDYTFYMSFFPHLVAGPIVRAKDFLHQIRKEIRFETHEIHEGLYLILKGLFKKAVIADYMAQYADLVFANPQGYSGFENLMAMYAYTLQIYCDFSGYSDMAIGIALLMGYRLLENFRSPYQSLNITEFWRRWHISLSTWLRDYIYIPLGGNRKGKTKQYLFLLITMLIGGFWHGASWKFIFWGLMHGLALVVHKWVSGQTWAKYITQTPLLLISGLLTFHYVAFLWIFFRANDFTTAFIMIKQIFVAMEWGYFLPFLQVRSLLVVLMLVGFGATLLPEKEKKLLYDFFCQSPTYWKIAFFLVIIQLVLQLKTESVQPFIYFQF